MFKTSDHWSVSSYNFSSSVQNKSCVQLSPRCNILNLKKETLYILGVEISTKALMT